MAERPVELQPRRQARVRARGRFWGRIRLLAVRVLRSAAAAEDVAQETLRGWSRRCATIGCGIGMRGRAFVSRPRANLYALLPLQRRQHDALTRSSGVRGPLRRQADPSRASVARTVRVLRTAIDRLTSRTGRFCGCSLARVRPAKSAGGWTWSRVPRGAKASRSPESGQIVAGAGKVSSDEEPRRRRDNADGEFGIRDDRHPSRYLRRNWTPSRPSRSRRTISPATAAGASWKSAWPSARRSPPAQCHGGARSAFRWQSQRESSWSPSPPGCSSNAQCRTRFPSTAVERPTRSRSQREWRARNGFCAGTRSRRHPHTQSSS